MIDINLEGLSATDRQKLGSQGQIAEETLERGLWNHGPQSVIVAVDSPNKCAALIDYCNSRGLHSSIPFVEDSVTPYQINKITTNYANRPDYSRPQVHSFQTRSFSTIPSDDIGPKPLPPGHPAKRERFGSTKDQNSVSSLEPWGKGLSALQGYSKTSVGLYAHPKTMVQPNRPFEISPAESSSQDLQDPAGRPLESLFDEGQETPPTPDSPGQGGCHRIKQGLLLEQSRSNQGLSSIEPRWSQDSKLEGVLTDVPSYSANPITSRTEEVNLQSSMNHGQDNIRFNRGTASQYVSRQIYRQFTKNNPQFFQNETSSWAVEDIQSQLFLFQQHLMHFNSFQASSEASPGWDFGLDSDKASESKKKKLSNVVYIKGVDQKKTSLQQLTNLLECFGNVEIAMFHSKKEYALLKFSDIQEAKYCVKELYGKEICGKSLLIHYSQFTEITPTYYTNEKIYFEPKKALKQVQPPKKIGHLSREVLLELCFLDPHQAYPLQAHTLRQWLGLGDFPNDSSSCGPQNTPWGNVKVRPGGEINSFVLEFGQTRQAVDFVMKTNYQEFEEGCFAALTFLPKSSF